MGTKEGRKRNGLGAEKGKRIFNKIAQLKKKERRRSRERKS